MVRYNGYSIIVSAVFVQSNVTSTAKEENALIGVWLGCLFLVGEETPLS